MENTISIHVGGSYSVMHNNRLTEKHSNPDIDTERSQDNLILVNVPIRKKYDEIFSEAVREFNQKQKRSDRKINNYFQKVRDSHLDEAKEVIFEIGNSEDLKRMAEEKECEIWETKEWALRTKVLQEYVQHFQEKNPSFVVFNATLHLDETNPHAHVDFIPVGSNMKKGLSKQVSMNGALADMGYNKKQTVTREKGKQAGKTITQLDNQKNFSDWREEQLKTLKTLAQKIYQEQEEEFRFIEGSKRKKHLHVEEYKQEVNAVKNEIHTLLDALGIDDGETGEAYYDDTWSRHYKWHAYTLEERLQRFRAQKEEMLTEAHILASERSEIKKEINTLTDTKTVLKTQIEALKVQFEEWQVLIQEKLQEIKERAKKAIKAILEPWGVKTREDEPVYFYNGRKKPYLLGTVQEVQEAIQEDKEEFWDTHPDFPDECFDCFTPRLANKLALYRTRNWDKSEFNQAQEEEKHQEWLTLREGLRDYTSKFKGQGIYINPSKTDLQKINRRVLYIENNQNLEDFTPEIRIQEVAHRAQKQVNHLLQNNPWQNKGRSR